MMLKPPPTIGYMPAAGAARAPRSCYQCRHHVGSWCQRIKTGIDPVSGGETVKVRGDARERRGQSWLDRWLGIDRCGNEGRFFEQRDEPWRNSKVPPPPPNTPSAKGDPR